jgi:hypothetical protein
LTEEIALQAGEGNSALSKSGGDEIAVGAISRVISELPVPFSSFGSSVKPA